MPFLRRYGLLIALLVVAVVIFTTQDRPSGRSGDVDDDPTARPRATARPTPDTSWIPAGFREVSDGVAVKTISGECTSFPCVAYEVVVRDGCPSGLYIEANVLDGSGTIVGYSNDVVQRIGSGDRAEVVLDILEDDGESTEVDCY